MYNRDSESIRIEITVDSEFSLPSLRNLSPLGAPSAAAHHRQLGVDDYGSENRRREQALSCENGNVWRILIHSDFVEKSFLHTDFVRC